MKGTAELALVKPPHRKQAFDETQIEQFVRCADSDTGPIYFLDNI